MTEQFEQQLLGYVLDALSDDERREVDRAIDRQPKLLTELDRLQAMLAPLAADADSFAPPPGLAQATISRIAEFERTADPVLAADAFGEDAFGEDAELDREIIRLPVAKALAAANGHDSGNDSGNGKHANGHHKQESPKVGLSPVTSREMSGDGGFGRRRFRLREFVTVFALASVALAMLLPAVSYSRYNSEIAGCQNNLREVGFAMTMYSRSHEGYFPMIPVGQETEEDRKAGVAGIFATRLLADGLLTDSRLLTCPAVPHEGDGVIIPSMQQLANSESFLHKFHEMMGGDYGYDLGHVNAKGEYVPTKNFNREYFAIMGDTPSMAKNGEMSDNHGIWGQNVLFESGRVAFVRAPDAGSGVDNFFLNDDGVVAAGKHWSDAVIAPSFARPNVYAFK